MRVGVRFAVGMKRGLGPTSQAGQSQKLLLLLALSIVLLAFLTSIFIGQSLRLTGAATTATGTVDLRVNGTITRPANVTAQGGGSSGASAIPTEIDTTSSIVASVESSGSDRQSISVTNNGYLTLVFSVSTTLPIVMLEQDEIVVRPGATAVVSFVIVGGTPGIHTGKIILRAGTIVREIPVVITVQAGYVSFQIEASIADAHRSIIAPAAVPVTVTIMTDVGGVFQLRYTLQDAANKKLIDEVDNFAVQDSASVTKTLAIPALPPGSYVVGVEASLHGQRRIVAIPLIVGTAALEEQPGTLAEMPVAVALADRSLLFFLLLAVAWIHRCIHRRCALSRPLLR